MVNVRSIKQLVNSNFKLVQVQVQLFPFLASTGSQEMQMFVRLYGPNLAKDLKKM